jgi:RHH-type proline utilization regulon transcriptional repressor/proline dehydrogenase/delta 1-pyrroline-5-carboxylate dehydrogenase
LDAARPHVSGAEHRNLIAAAASDQIAWTREYGVLKDVSKLGVERNVFRYVPVPVSIRFDGFLPELIRVLLAATRTGAPIAVSSRTPLPADVAPKATTETHDEWLAQVAKARPTRIRLVGPDAKDVAVAVEGDPDVAIYSGAVTPSGRVEALPFLQEQSITITNHRFGNHDPEFELVLPRKP